MNFKQIHGTVSFCIKMIKYYANRSEMILMLGPRMHPSDKPRDLVAWELKSSKAKILLLHFNLLFYFILLTTLNPRHGYDLEDEAGY